MEKTIGPRTSVRCPGKEEGSTREGWEGLLSERRRKWRKQCPKSQIVRVCPKVGSDGRGQVLLKAKVIYPGGSDDKEFACNAGELGSIPGLGRPPREGNGNPSQYSCLENPCGQRGLAGSWHIVYWVHIAYWVQHFPQHHLSGSGIAQLEFLHLH